MGLGPIDRLELFFWALAQLACYGIAALTALALLTRPRETAGLLLGARGLRAALRLFGPAGEAAARAGGGALLRSVMDLQARADALTGRLLGSRDPAVTAGIWSGDLRPADPAAPATAAQSSEATPHE